MAEILLSVDNEDVSIVETQRLFQRNPFPGGHRYRLEIRGSAGLEWFRGVSSGSPVTGEVQQAVLFLLDRLVAEEAGELVPARFLINSVDSILRTADQLVLEGECSEVVEML